VLHASSATADLKVTSSTLSTDLRILLFVALCCFAPFLGKAFSIDDPLFLWTAEQIRREPTDFFGFHVNWYGHETPMHVLTKNPPLAAYYIAAAITLFGKSESALHMAFLLPNVGLVFGAYFIARRMCQFRLVAALAMLLTPVLVVSATSVMCDTMMLALWCWAIVAWLAGLERQQNWLLLAAAILMGLAALTKYFGVCLIPLLLVYTLAVRRRPGVWLLALAVPVAMIVAYELYTRRLYGAGMFFEAQDYASKTRAALADRPWRQFAVFVLFLGGCYATLLCYLPIVFPVWQIAVVVLAGSCMTGALWLSEGVYGSGLSERMFGFPIDMASGRLVYFPLHAGVFVAASMLVTLLLINELVRRRDANSILLCLWILGTLTFTADFNWTINGRSLLPAAPAIGILLARQLESRCWPWLARDRTPLAWCAVPALLFSLFIAWGDYRHAQAGRNAAEELYARYSALSDPLWFEGHWGFQYYLQQLGGRPIDFSKDTLHPDDLVIVPRQNTNIFDLPTNVWDEVARLNVPVASTTTTLRHDMGVSFYNGARGVPLPYVVAHVRPEMYQIYRMRDTVTLSGTASRPDAAH